MKDKPNPDTVSFEIEYEYDEHGNRKLTQASKDRAAKALNDYWDEQEKSEDEKG